MKLPPEELALMISTIFFTSGLCTLIQQSALGNKLPVIQGGTFSFLGPTFAIIGMVAAKKLTGAEPMWQIQIQHVVFVSGAHICHHRHGGRQETDRGGTHVANSDPACGRCNYDRLGV
jgi:xanthine/uracil permease